MMKRMLFMWGPVIAWMSVIFYFSSRGKTPVTDSYVISFLFFKTLHLIEYSCLYVLLYRAMRNTTELRKRNIAVLALGVVVLYASSDELHQFLVPTREGRVRDVIIDTIGGGIGWILSAHVIPALPKKLRALAGW
jgi:VanZ family protein